MGQGPNESNGFETNGKKYKCVRAYQDGVDPPPG